MTDLYPLRRDMKDIVLNWRESHEPNLRSGGYDTVYGSAPLKAVVLPVAFTLRVGDQRNGDLNLHGGYYDQHRRQFLLDEGHERLVEKNWIMFENLRYEIESIDKGPGDAIRVTARQEKSVEPVNYIIEEVRSTLFVGEQLDDQS